MMNRATISISCTIMVALVKMVEMPLSGNFILFTKYG